MCEKKLLAIILGTWRQEAEVTEKPAEWLTS
jgi:hypothetical protein